MKKHTIRITKTKLAAAGLGLALVLQALVPFLVPSASAGTLTSTYVRLDRMATGQDTTWELDFTTASAGATSLSVDFTSAWTSASGTVSTTQAIGACADSSDTSLPGSPTASGSGSVVSVSSITALSASTAYCEAFTTSNSVHTPTAGQYQPVVTVGSDSVTAAVDVLSAGADQITVTATVNPSFSMALGGWVGSADPLGSLSTGSVTTSSPAGTATVNTNAANGWMVWAKDSNAGLHSTTASYTIGSNCSGGVGTNSTLSAGTEGYNLGVVATSQTGGTGTVDVNSYPFHGASSHQGGGLCTTYQTIAKSNGTADTSLLTIKNNAAISGITKAATDYTDLETFVGAGLF